MITRGTYWRPLSHLRKNFFAAFAVRVDAAPGYRAHCHAGQRPATESAVCHDFQENLIQMPCVSRLAMMMLQCIGVGLTKFQAPLPNRCVGQHNATLCHELFDITETDREAKIQPHTVTNNLRMETEPFVEGS